MSQPLQLPQVVDPFLLSHSSKPNQNKSDMHTSLTYRKFTLSLRPLIKIHEQHNVLCISKSVKYFNMAPNTLFVCLCEQATHRLI